MADERVDVSLPELRALLRRVLAEVPVTRVADEVVQRLRLGRAHRRRPAEQVAQEARAQERGEVDDVQMARIKARLRAQGVRV